MRMERSSPVQLGEATFTLGNNCLQTALNGVVSVRRNRQNGSTHVTDKQYLALAKIAARALAAVVAIGSLVVLSQWAASAAAPESPSGDEAFDNSYAGTSTVNAVGELPSTELLSWPSDWLYHRTVRF